MRTTYAIRIRHADGSVARFYTVTDDAQRFLRIVGLVPSVTYAAARPLPIGGNAMRDNNGLRARVASLETALREADCPYPVDEARDASVGACVDAGCCGCRLGTPLQEVTL